MTLFYKGRVQRCPGPCLSLGRLKLENSPVFFCLSAELAKADRASSPFLLAAEPQCQNGIAAGTKNRLGNNMGSGTCPAGVAPLFTQEGSLSILQQGEEETSGAVELGLAFAHTVGESGL